MLQVAREVHAAFVGHAYDGLPLEACGLLGGTAASGTATVFYPCANVAASSRVYTVDPRDHLRAERDAEGRGLEILGVMHSPPTPRPTRARPTWRRRPTPPGTT